MIRIEDVYQIGRMGKAHGLKGEINFQFTDDVWDRAESDHIIYEVDGILVPFFIEEYRFRSDTVALVKFEDVDTQQRAQELTGSDVYFPRSLADDDAPSLTSLVGFDIVDAQTAVPVGRIAAIDDSTANLLFELEDGRLIPAAEELITGIDTSHRQISLNIPQGLLEL
jgi:16S rRNA processing protein RimM